jgi:uridine phosphorylase
LFINFNTLAEQHSMSLPLAASELIINTDGSIYHLNLRPEQIAHDIITVGDPNRVDTVAKHLDQIELDIQNENSEL